MCTDCWIHASRERVFFHRFPLSPVSIPIFPEWQRVKSNGGQRAGWRDTWLMLTLSYSIGEGRYTYCETIPKGLVSFHPASPPGFSSYAILWPWNVVCEFRIDIYTCRMFKNWSGRRDANTIILSIIRSIIRIIDIAWSTLYNIYVYTNWKKINSLSPIKEKWSWKIQNSRECKIYTIRTFKFSFLFTKSVRTTDWTRLI